MPKAGSGTVSYPGGKTTLAPWIIDHMPAHECYVEPFGGSASVLHNKPPSDIEVYNDLQSDIVHFFRVVRNRPDDLVEWLKATPYSRELHHEFADYQDDRPDDSVERAGQFFYLLQTSYGGKLRSPSFKTHSSKESAQSFGESFVRSKRNLFNVAERFESVIIESLDYTEVFEKYDHEGTFFYCDPPYLTETKHYLKDDFGHEEFVDQLAMLEGYWMVSYDELPPGLEEYQVVSRDREWTMSDSTGTEKLVMNYDPSETPGFVDGEKTQRKLTEVA